MEQTTDGTSLSTPDIKAAIRETRVRLATRLARTADHVHDVFRAPSAAHAEARDGWCIGGAVNAIAIAGRARRAWTDAKRTGVVRRAVIGAVTVAVAAVLAARRRRP